MRPQASYRHEFRRLILAEDPAAVLEVGSGDGGFLQAMQAAGVHAEGLEVAAASVDALRRNGAVAHVGRAELLPFADRSFDLVVSEFCAHHFADLDRHLSEARRVARRAVFLMDPWYDLSIASQRVAERWDRWFKAIDRAAGEVHHDVLDADRFRRALGPVTGWSFECRHLLQLVDVDDTRFAAEHATYLAKARSPAAAAAELQAIAELRARDGLTDDGAILVLLRRPS